MTSVRSRNIRGTFHFILLRFKFIDLYYDLHILQSDDNNNKLYGQDSGPYHYSNGLFARLDAN